MEYINNTVLMFSMSRIEYKYTVYIIPETRDYYRTTTNKSNLSNETTIYNYSFNIYQEYLGKCNPATASTNLLPNVILLIPIIIPLLWAEIKHSYWFSQGDKLVTGGISAIAAF